MGGPAGTMGQPRWGEVWSRHVLPWMDFCECGFLPNLLRYTVRDKMLLINKTFMYEIFFVRNYIRRETGLPQVVQVASMNSDREEHFPLTS